jgi:pSer/pThr/pTyr-binding forkhead associated (FHA) protein
MSATGARIEVVSGNATGTVLIVEDELILGRHADGPGRLAGDEEISRSHARLSLDGSGFCAVEDLGSTNGTFVNGLRISAPQTLSEGDTIELGTTTLVVQELPQMAGASAAPHIESDRDQPTPVHLAPQEPEEAEEPWPPLELDVEVDFVAREARLRLDEASEPIRLVFDQGQWQIQASPPPDKGDPA